ncbi:MAG: type III pantothenate kinase [Lachnospiraceae bacterium]|nr:type III pantothenate kinase [Lachnospiraceae bacterium]
MILAIDVGNIHTIMGCIDETKKELRAEHVFRFRTDRAATAHEYAIKMKALLQLQEVDPQSVRGAIVASVVPALTSTVSAAVEILTGEKARIVGPGMKTGLKIMLDDPGTIAADLVVAAVAAKEEYPLPCVIIDMGTATTITVVDENGAYIGGAILPGAAVSLEALTENASLLPDIDIVPPKKIIATNTIDAMKAGIIFGQAGAIDGTITRFAKALGREPASIVTTGGTGALISPYCDHDIQVDDQLLLKGLAILWKKTESEKGEKRKK